MSKSPLRILVTGGSGKAGAFVIQELLQHGYEVVNVDLKPSTLIHTFYTDLTDLGQVYGMMQGKDAVIHLAAIPWPGEHPPEVVFRNNVLSTFNILEAAAVLGVNKVVLAGSESALGFPFRFTDFSPLYLPVDEEHPLLAQDSYGLSKIILEELGKGFARRNPKLSVISLRLSYIQTNKEDYLREMRACWQDPSANSFNLWAYVDARDVATAFRMAIEYPQPGFEAFYIAAPDTLMRQPTLELVQRYFKGAIEVRENFGDTQSPLNCQKAHRLLGFQPQYTWRDWVQEEEVLAPKEGAE